MASYKNNVFILAGCIHTYLYNIAKYIYIYIYIYIYMYVIYVLSLSMVVLNSMTMDSGFFVLLTLAM